MGVIGICFSVLDRDAMKERRTGLETLGQVADCLLLIRKRCSWLMVQPPKLLEHFGVIGLMLKDPTVRISSVLKLDVSTDLHPKTEATHFTILLIDMSELEPDIPRG